MRLVSEASYRASVAEREYLRERCKRLVARCRWRLS